MTCTEVLELLPAAIDGQMGEELLSKLRLHLNECSNCLHEFELERMTKNVVRKHARSAQPPAYLLDRIKSAVHRERTALGVPPATPVVRRRPTWPAMIAVGAIGAIILLFVVISPIRSHHHSHTQPADGNVVHETYNNFDGVLNGTLRPEIVTEDPKKVMAFFQPMVDFNVQVPSMHAFKLVGAMCSQYNGKCIAQLVYRGTQDVVYLYEVKLSRVLRNESGFQLSPEAIAQIQSSRWYFENHLPDCSLAMWVVDSTLCCAVADINKDVLFASLTESRQ